MRIFKTLLVVLVIAWGLLAAGVRLATPLLADYRDELAALAGERIGQTVTIGGLKARWHGLRPLLELRDVTVGEAPRTIDIARIDADLAPAGLLRGGLVDALRLTVDGLQLTAVRVPGGQIHLEGLVAPAASLADDGNRRLPGTLRLINTRVLWVDRRDGRAPLPINDIDILVDRDGPQVNVRARLHTAAGRAEFAARVTGLLDRTDWHGDSYLRVDNMDVARLLGDYLPAGYGLQHTLLDLQAWTTWQAARPVRSQGRVSLRDVRLRPTSGESLDLTLLAARFSVERGAGALRLGLSGLQVATHDSRWPRSALALAVQTDADGRQHVDLAAAYLRLEDVAGLVRVRSPGARIDEALGALQPRGDVHDLRLQLTRDGDATRWRATARFDALGSAPWGRIPGIDNLSGRVHGSDVHTVLTLDSHDATLRFSELFRDPLRLPRIAGRVDLTHAGNGWALRSDALQADADHLRTLTRVALRQAPGESLFIDLQTGFHDGDAAFASHYYPVGIMSAPLVDWLDGSIASGRVVRGTALVHGPLDDYAFENTRSGNFEVVFDTEDVELAYRDGWPAIRGLDARVRFHGNRLGITAHDGCIYDSRITELDARIPSLDPLAPVRIRGQVSGPLTDPLRLLGEPGLRERFGALADRFRATGDSQLGLDFAIPLGEKGDLALDGALRFAGNRLSLPDRHLALDGITGELALSADGLRATGIHATTLGRPVRIDVLPVDRETTRVRVRGRFRPDDLSGRLEGLPLALLDGEADVVVDVDVPADAAAGGAATRLAVRSDLSGIAVDLPAPLGKPAATRRELVVDIPLGNRGTPGSVGYGDRVEARFTGDGRRVAVQLGGGSVRLPPDRGIRIEGRLDELDVDAWQATLARLPRQEASSRAPLALELHIDRFRAAGLGIDDVNLSALRATDVWRGSVRSANLAGTFELPSRPGRAPVVVELERLAFDLPADDDTTPPPDASAGPDPAELPGLDLRVADLQIGTAQLGRLELLATPVPAGLDITRLSATGGQLTVDASGSWLDTGAAYRTTLTGHAEAADLGQLLVDVGYSRQIENAPVDSDFALAWPGNPAQFHAATLDGMLEIDVGKGRLVELDPGVTRVFGLLNLNALTRRLRLDFSDFYKKGYSFDSISGSFAFAGGKATTSDLGMSGPSGRIDVRGSTDLIARTLDQKVMVTPEFNATLPIAGTLAGGPVAGIAVLVAQQVMDKQVDRMNRFDYAVTGPWAQPDVVQLDTSGSLSKLLKPFRDGPATDGAGSDGPDGVADTPGATGTAGNGTSSPIATPHDGDDDSGDAAETDARDTEKRSRNPLRGLLDLLEKGEPHGLDLPGQQD